VKNVKKLKEVKKVKKDVIAGPAGPNDCLMEDDHRG